MKMKVFLDTAKPISAFIKQAGFEDRLGKKLSQVFNTTASLNLVDKFSKL